MLRVFGSMKYLLFAFSALFLDMIGSCRHSEPDFLEVSPNAVMFDSHGGSATIEVSSNTRWDISVSEWLEVSPSSGNNDAEIRVTALPNESTRERSCALIIIGGDEQEEVRVYQKGEAFVDD